jgi:WXG100 family type VII secretion target
MAIVVIIRSDYDQLKTIGSGWRKQEEATKQTIGKLKSVVEQLKGGDWIGEGADAFYQEMEGLVMPGLTRLEQAMAEASSVTNEISQIYREAEDNVSTLWKVIPGLEIGISG